MVSDLEKDDTMPAPAPVLSRRAMVLAAVAAPAAVACGRTAPGVPPAAPAGLERELVLYSARKEELFQPVADLFQKQTGVKVAVKSGAPGELALLVEQEQSSPRGDIFFTTDAADAHTLGRKGLLEPYKSPNAEKVPAEFKAADGTWTGVIGRSRNIVANATLVKPADQPKSVFDLTAPVWRGKLAMASIREGGVRLWLASLILARGEAATTRYLTDLLANGLKVLANHTEVTNAVARGEFALGLINHYYYVRAKKEGAPLDLIYPDQGPNDIGTVVTPIAVGIIKGAQRPRAARAFVDFILTREGQVPMTTQGQEFPLTPGAPLGDAAVPGVKPIDQIKRPNLDFVKIAEAQQRAVELYTPLLS